MFLVEIIDGNKKERHLCQPCAGSIFEKLPPAPWASYEPSPSIPVDLRRPPDATREVEISDPISVRELAAVLQVKFYRIIEVLMHHGIYTSAERLIDFHTASLVCAAYGVTPHRLR